MRSRNPAVARNANTITTVSTIWCGPRNSRAGSAAVNATVAAAVLPRRSDEEEGGKGRLEQGGDDVGPIQVRPTRPQREDRLADGRAEQHGHAGHDGGEVRLRGPEEDGDGHQGRAGARQDE